MNDSGDIANGCGDIGLSRAILHIHHVIISMAVFCTYNYMLSYAHDQLSRLTVTEQLNDIARPN